MACAPLAQRIEAREEVAKVPIGVDEPDDGPLSARVRGRRGGTSGAKIEACEEPAPAIFHGIRVAPPTLIVGFDGIQIPAADKVGAAHDGLSYTRGAHGYREGAPPYHHLTAGVATGQASRTYFGFIWRWGCVWNRQPMFQTWSCRGMKGIEPRVTGGNPGLVGDPSYH